MVFRWLGGMTRRGSHMEGHRLRWTGGDMATRTAQMVVVAIRDGAQGGQLETRCINMYRNTSKNYNVAPSSVGTSSDRDAVNFFYIVYW